MGPTDETTYIYEHSIKIFILRLFFVPVSSFRTQLWLFFFFLFFDFVVGGLTLRPCWWLGDAANEFLGP